MTEYDDRSCASNMYLPSCTYYVSAPDFTSVSSFLPQNTSCQINFPYSPNITQVQPVREVAFRDYGLDHPGKWHYRGNYASYYSTDDIMHRDLIQQSPGGRADVRFKNDSLYGHRAASGSPCGFFTGIGRNGVLPQGFDQFLDAPNSDKPTAESLKQKTDYSATPTDAANNSSSSSQDLTKLEENKAEPSGSVDEDSSSNCGDKSNQHSESVPLCFCFGFFFFLLVALSRKVRETGNKIDNGEPELLWVLCSGRSGVMCLFYKHANAFISY